MISFRILSPSFRAFVALSVGFLLASTNLRAGTIDADHLPTIKMQVESATSIWDYSPSASAYVASTDGSGYELSAPLDAYGVCDHTANVQVKELQFNSDPFVLNNILVTNTTAAPQIFSITVGLPTVFGAPNVISGNVRTNVIDGGLDGAAISSVVGNPVYLSQIDFNPVVPLQTDPFVVTAPAGGSNTASASFGPVASGIPVTSNIGVQLRFMLSPGDTAAILSRFDVNPIPEPGTFALCGGALVLAAGTFSRRLGRRLA